MSTQKPLANAKPTNILELVSEWASASDDNTFDWYANLDLLLLLRDHLYTQYQPFPETPDYANRLFTWVNQVASTADKKTLFELATWLMFVGYEEMSSLYRSSFADVVTRWVIDEARIDIASPLANDEIQRSLNKTFFGSIAGMDMGTYCRTNGIQGQSFRPDFRERSSLDKPDSIRDFLIGSSGNKDRRYDRIVAVEDFVGSGQQMEEASDYLAQLSDFSVLLSPILVANEGFEVGVDLESRFAHITFQPLFRLPRENAVPEVKIPRFRGPTFHRRVRRLLNKIWPQTKGNAPTQPLYGPFGCGGVGSLILTYLNCP